MSFFIFFVFFLIINVYLGSLYVFNAQGQLGCEEMTKTGQTMHYLNLR